MKNLASVNTPYRIVCRRGIGDLNSTYEVYKSGSNLPIKNQNLRELFERYHESAKEILDKDTRIQSITLEIKL